MNLRAQAALILQDVMKGRSLTDALSYFLPKWKDARDRALLQELTFGTCRWYFYLEKIIRIMLEKPLKNKDQDIYALLLIGLYQLIFMRIPHHAAITETVESAASLKKIWAKGLINAVLRKYQRTEVIKKTDFSHPEWMIKKIKRDFPESWEAILDANNERPPMALRVNQQRISRESYLEKLKHSHLSAWPIPKTKSGIMLEKPLDIHFLPGFKEGLVSVQDGAAQLAAEFIDIKPHQKVLDACAAPGGKTAHLLELEPTVDCIAIDHDQERVTLIKENLDRLHLTAKCKASDVTHISAWWDGQLFDRILLDAPCSASGVIRRHPDIKLLRRESDIDKLSAIQFQLLNSVWSLLKPAGKLLYVTCSVFSEENREVIERFKTVHREALEEQMIQIEPGKNGMDGFFFARLQKIKS